MNQAESIARAVEASEPIDVLVNNAVVAAIGTLEATPMVTAGDIHHREWSWRAL